MQAPLRIAFTQRPEDRAALTAALSYQDTQGFRNRIARASVISILVLGAYAAVAMRPDLFRRVSWSRADLLDISVLAVFVLIYCIVVKYIADRFVLTRWAILRRHLKLARARSLVTEEASLELAADHLHLTTPRLDSRMDWSLVQQVIETPTHLHLVLGPGTGIPIPRADLPPDAFAAVQAFVAAHHPVR